MQDYIKIDKRFNPCEIYMESIENSKKRIAEKVEEFYQIVGREIDAAKSNGELFCRLTIKATTSCDKRAFNITIDLLKEDGFDVKEILNHNSGHVFTLCWENQKTLGECFKIGSRKYNEDKKEFEDLIRDGSDYTSHW